MKFETQFAEKREIVKAWNKSSSMGHSSMFVECPYCHNAVLVFIWSWSGCGKRCYDCLHDFHRKVILSPWGAFRYDPVFSSNTRRHRKAV